MKASDKEKKEVLAKVAKLKKQGYQILSADDPANGKKGFVARSQDEIPIRKYFEWSIFDGPIEKDSKTVSVEEFTELMRSSRWASCDDAKTLRLGLIRFDFTKNVIHTRYCPVSQVKSLEPADGKAFQESLQRLRSKVKTVKT